MSTNKIKVGLFIASCAIAANSNAASCGDVSVADMNWASAEVAAHLDKYILENAYGCSVELVPGDTVPTLTSMIEKKQPDIAPELWVNSARESFDAAVEENKLIVAGNIFKDGGEDGWWIPRYTAEKHKLKTVADVLAHPELFPAKESPGKGAFVTCPSGWGCQLVNANLYKAFGLQDAGFEIIDSGSAAGLDGSIAKAFERGQNWFGYYWAPTAILGKYDMVKLDFDAEFNADNWHNCIVKEFCESPQKTSWIESDVRTAVVANLVERVPTEVMDYLSKRSYGNDVLNGVLSWMTEEQANGEDAALYFLERHEEVWTQWMSQESAQQIKAGL